MSLTGNRKLYQTPVTRISATPEFAIGEEREEFDETYGLKRYRYAWADDTITINQALTEDITASATGRKVYPPATAGLPICGVAEVAVTDEYYFWMTIVGKVNVIQKTGTVVGTVLTATTTAGALGPTLEADSTGAYKNTMAYAMVANASGGDVTGLAKINCA